MFSLHCQQESNRTNVFYMHVLKDTNVSPTAGFLFSSVPPGSHVFHPWWQGQPVSAWNNWQFFSQSGVRPINHWKSHPYQPSSAVAQSLKICPIMHTQRKTPGMPGSPVSIPQPGESCWVLGLWTRCSCSVGSWKPDMSLSIQLHNYLFSTQLS